MKKMLKVAAIFMSAAFVMLVLACPQNEPTPSPEPTPTPGPTPTLNPFSLSVDVPTAKRNTALELTVNLTTEGQVKRVLYKEGIHDKYAMLGASSGATAATATSDNKKWTFTVNKNAKFTVVAEDDLDRSAITEVEVTCFDYAAPGNVTNLAATYTAEHQKITVMWNNPTDEDFAELKISWQRDSESYCEPITLNTDTETYTIDSVDDTASYNTVQIKTYDTLGNESNGSYKSVGIASPLGQAYTILPAGTNGTAGTTGTYIEFGRWPQTIKADNVTVDKNSTESQEVGMFTYYKGNDDEWYCEALENAHATEEHYKYTNGDQAARKSANSYKWFKVEPIKWRVLTDNYSGKKLILCESAIYAGICYYDSFRINRDIGGSTIYPNNYEHSRIRAWLNGLSFQLGDATNSDHDGRGFLQTAFTAEEQTAIAMTTVDNSAESTNYESNSYTCDNTDDKVFLLSTKEASTEAYGFKSDIKHSDERRIRKPTDFTIASGADIYSPSLGTGWWFRSPNNESDGYVHYIYYNGVIYTSINRDVSSGYHTVVPALSLAP